MSAGNSTDLEWTDHYIVMLDVVRSAGFDDDEQLRKFAEIYRQIEGEEALRQAVAEFRRIIEHDDWAFLEKVNVTGFTREHFMRMTIIAEEVLDDVSSALT